jgi:ATP-dependent protease ClpP protease subunit
MSPVEAKEYGLIDQIVTHRGEVVLTNGKGDTREK